MLYKMHLKIQPSRLPNAGKGLFAIDKKLGRNMIVFRENQRIIAYGGEAIDGEMLNDRYGNKTGPYAMALSEEDDDARYLDTACFRTIASTINHDRRLENCWFQIVGRRGHESIVIRATKDIRNGQELLCDYGNSYKMNGYHTTK